MAHGSKVHLPEVFPIKKMCEPKTAALLARMATWRMPMAEERRCATWTSRCCT